MCIINFCGNCQIKNFNPNWTISFNSNTDTTFFISKQGAIKALKLENDSKGFAEILRINREETNLYRIQASDCFCVVDTLTIRLLAITNVKAKYKFELKSVRKKRRFASIENWVWRSIAVYAGYRFIKQ